MWNRATRSFCRTSEYKMWSHEFQSLSSSPPSHQCLKYTVRIWLMPTTWVRRLCNLMHVSRRCALSSAHEISNGTRRRPKHPCSARIPHSALCDMTVIGGWKRFCFGFLHVSPLSFGLPWAAHVCARRYASTLAEMLCRQQGSILLEFEYAAFRRWVRRLVNHASCLEHSPEQLWYFLLPS